MALYLSITLFVLMPMEREILQTQRLAPDGIYSVPLELKGRTFYVSNAESSQRQRYQETATACVAGAIFGLMLLALTRLFGVRRPS